MLRNVISGVLTRLFRRKSMARESLELNTSQLARVLTVWDLTALGVGSTLGKPTKCQSFLTFLRIQEMLKDFLHQFYPA